MRTKMKIDLEQVEEMASEFCTQEEIAEDMGFDRTIFHRREDVRAAFLRGKNAAKISLRHMMYLAARNGDRTMMIFLSKNELGYQDRPEPKEADDKVVEKSNKQIESLAKLINNPVPERTFADVEGVADDADNADAVEDTEDTGGDEK